eukprot:3136673-Pleurochrysis_carterae.AAC.4
MCIRDRIFADLVADGHAALLGDAPRSCECRDSSRLSDCDARATSREEELWQLRCFTAPCVAKHNHDARCLER